MSKKSSAGEDGPNISGNDVERLPPLAAAFLILFDLKVGPDELQNSQKTNARAVIRLRGNGPYQTVCLSMPSIPEAASH
ncbi:MAG: hypothetical protein Q9157_009072 [Trypethelium eluteriae]